MSRTRDILKRTASVFVLLVFVYACMSVKICESTFAVTDSQTITAVKEIDKEPVIPEDSELDESDVLLEEYLDKNIKDSLQKNISTKKRSLMKSSSRGDKLADDERTLYTALKNQIDEVACGNNDSTAFELSFAEIFPDRYSDGTRKYSAEDLNVDEIVVKVDGNNTITEEAQDAAFDEYLVDYVKVFDALMADSPYSLYWFDKTAGMYPQIIPYFRASYDAGNDEWFIWCDPNESAYIFYFVVANEYAPDEFDAVDISEDGEPEIFVPIQTDTVLTKAVSSTVESVNTILEESKNKSNLDKLKSYKDVICERVSYNSYAANDSNNVPYGNPWQLIYVFDNDPDTNVVCEGYSKAFKYLCDLTETFSGADDSSSIDCYLMTGDMASRGNAEPHMWNVVKMNDKGNYLVDVTNCDSGETGSDRLFMKGSQNGTADGYTVSEMVYTYDADAKRTFTENERRLAAKDYSEEETPADTSESEGSIKSNNETELRNSLGGPGNVDVEKSTINGRTVITATLKKDINLSEPLRLIQGEPGDKVIIDLNGKTITAAAGTSGTDEDAAMGQSAIEIEAGAFDVEIKGPGSVIGGKGAVLHDEDIDFKSGYYGGDAVRFVNSSYYPTGANARLDYGLTVTGGAVLRGGDGADVSSAEWLYDIENFSGDRYSAPNFVSGSGGAGIGQEAAGLGYSNTISYAKIVVDNGTVSGGLGGNIDMTAITPTTYALMTSSAVAAVMNGVSVKDYPFEVMSFVPMVGRGGDGIRIGGGRKYINIGTSGAVSGSSCGSVDFGNNKTFELLGSSYSYGDYAKSGNFHAGTAGNGIAVWVGDIGLTNAVPGFTGNEWQSRTADSDDMGIYVAGTVTGGSTPDTDSLGQFAGAAGAGIALYGDSDLFGIEDEMEYHRQWGIVDIEGSVSGGNGGNAVSGSGGGGGYGIFEDYTVEHQDDGTNHYIVNGTVKGGNGGSSSGASDLTDAGFFGHGGNGMAFMDQSREDLYVVGNGNVVSGNAGNTVNRGRGSSMTSDSVTEAIHLNPTSEPGYYPVTVNVNQSNGSGAQALNKNKVTVSATMTNFSNYPTTSTKVSCTVNKPSGYTGKVYVKWFAEIQLQNNDPVICELEPSGTNPLTFNMLSNGNYKYLAYPKAASYDLKNAYNYDISTTNRIKDTLEYNGSTCRIYCYVLLEDGSWGKSNVMEFDKNGWSGGSGGGTDPTPGGETDQQAADRVMDMIDALPLLANITLEHADQVAAARAAYEALTPAQKELLAQYTYLLDDLGRAEAKIAELQQEEEEKQAADREAAEQATQNINDILDQLDLDSFSLDPNDPANAEDIAEVKALVEEAVAIYDALTDEQKRLVDQTSLQMLRDVVANYNSSYGNSESGGAVDGPTLPKKQLTANMVTVANATYTGSALKPKVTVKDGTKVLVNGTDYTVAYSNNTNAGKTAKATITGKGQYEGTVAKTFTINVRKITPAVTLSKTAFTYNGKVQTPTVTVKDGSKKLATSQYTVTLPKGRKNVGQYTIKVTLKANYSGTKSVTYKINPKGTSLSKVTRGTKAFTAAWKKQTGKMASARIAGYQIQYSLKKNFSSGNKLVTVSGYNKASRAVKGLKAKKTYYVRIRTYMKVGGKNYYSGWSKVKAVKTK